MNWDVSNWDAQLADDTHRHYCESVALEELEDAIETRADELMESGDFFRDACGEPSNSYLDIVVESPLQEVCKKTYVYDLLAQMLNYEPDSDEHRQAWADAREILRSQYAMPAARKELV